MNAQSNLYHTGNFEEIKHTQPLLRSTVFISPFSRTYLSHARCMLHVPLITLTIASFCALFPNKRHRNYTVSISPTVLLTQYRYRPLCCKPYTQIQSQVRKPGTKLEPPGMLRRSRPVI